MSSHTKENYIKAIYHLHQKDEDISLSAIGEDLNVSKPTVNNMIKKLSVDGIVQHEKYKPIRITPKGQKVAAEIVRRHRLSEMFLTQIMNFGWEEVHDIAEELEHISSDKFFDRMDEMLGFPTVDPHGSPIPNKNGEYHKPAYVPLSKANVGERYKVKALKSSEAEFLLLLNEKDIALETQIKVNSIEKFDKSMQISYTHHANEVISAAMSQLLLVQKIANEN